MRQRSARTSAAASGRRRAAASSSANARSAVVSVSTPGVLPTRTPRALQALTSMLSKQVMLRLLVMVRGRSAVLTLPFCLVEEVLNRKVQLETGRNGCQQRVLVQLVWVTATQAQVLFFFL